MSEHSLLQLFSVNGKNYQDFLKQMNLEIESFEHTQNELLSNHVKPADDKLNRSQNLYNTFEPHADFISQINNMEFHDAGLLVISCGWSDDAIEVLPVIAKMMEAVNGIEMRCLHVDQFPDVAKEYLTRGVYDDPQLLFLDGKTGKLLGSWGPRPDPLQKMVEAFLINPDAKREDMEKALRYWYKLDEGKAIQEEIAQWIIRLSNQSLT